MKKTLTICLLFCLTLLTSTAQTTDQLYVDFLKKNLKNFEKNTKRNGGVYIDGKIVSIIIDPNGEQIDGVVLPTVLKESSQFRYRIIVLTDKDDDADYSFKIDGKEYNPVNDFVIFNTQEEDDVVVEAIPDPTDNIKMLVSDTSDVFSEKVFFEAKKDDQSIFNWDIKLTSSTRYHVAIMGGYYHTTLNNPTNLVKFGTGNGTDSTLIGDFTEHQRKLTVTAVFYPWERSTGYSWKDLKFHERFSFAFGIGLDEDLFDDLFLGVNLEFAKGGYFTGGIHCGKHNVLVNNKDFDYGTDLWNLPFDNTLVKEEWDIGYFAGVTIDLRVISSMIGTRDKLNKKDNDE